MSEAILLYENEKTWVPKVRIVFDFLFGNFYKNINERKTPKNPRIGTSLTIERSEIVLINFFGDFYVRSTFLQLSEHTTMSEAILLYENEKTWVPKVRIVFDFLFGNFYKNINEPKILGLAHLYNWAKRNCFIYFEI